MGDTSIALRSALAGEDMALVGRTLDSTDVRVLIQMCADHHTRPQALAALRAFSQWYMYACADRESVCTFTAASVMRAYSVFMHTVWGDMDRAACQRVVDVAERALEYRPVPPAPPLVPPSPRPFGACVVQ